MAQPTDTPSWATGLTAAITAPSSGKKALGFVDLEYPRAEHLNYLFNLLSLWINYLASLQVNQKFHWVPASVGVLTGGSTIDSATGAVNGAGGVNYIPIAIGVGDQITDISFTILGNNSQNATIQLVTGDGAGGLSVLATASVPLASNTWQRVDTALTGITTVDGHSYWIRAFWGGGSGALVFVQTVGYATQAV